MKKRVLVFSSGTKDGGGSGFENLVNASRNHNLDFEVVGVISSQPEGGVKLKAEKLEVPFHHFEKPYSAERYAELIKKYDPDVIALSGWLKLVTGLDPKITINIHPGPLPTFGGAGMYGHHVHEAVIEAYKRGELTHSAVSMHFVTEQYDEGPVFFVCQVEIDAYDTAETLSAKVNAIEHKWQPIVTEKVANGEISWDGKDPLSMKGALFM